MLSVILFTAFLYAVYCTFFYAPAIPHKKRIIATRSLSRNELYAMRHYLALAHS